MDHNPFLRDFMKMRQAVSVPITHGKPKVENKKPKPIKPLQEATGPTIGQIIEEKPKKKVVIEFLQLKANKLTEEKMKA